MGWIEGMRTAGVVMVVALAAGPATAQTASGVEGIMQADRDFAARAAEAGVQTAFTEYMDAVDGRMVRGGGDTVVGEAAIREYFAATPPETLLHWEPQEGFVSDGDDFGVTWGKWELHPDGNRSTAAAARGTYVTVWRRDANGVWRGLLDMGSNDPSYRPPDTEADSQSAPEDD